MPNAKRLSICKKEIRVPFARAHTSEGVNNILKIPLRTNSVEHSICVAVIHHLPTEVMRLRAIQEIVRITHPGGTIFIQVWALEQIERQTQKKKIRKEADQIIPWTLHNGTKLPRYYHFFRKNELESLVQQIKSVTIIDTFFEHNNWGIVITKQEFRKV